MVDKVIDTSPIAEATGLATVPEGPFFDEMRELEFERDPQSDAIVQAQTDLGGDVEIDDPEVAREEMRVNDILPSRLQERINRSPALYRDFLRENHAEITKGDPETILDLVDASEKAKTFTEKATSEVRKKGLRRVFEEAQDVGSKQWRLTTGHLDSTAESLKAVEDLNSGKISKTEYDLRLKYIKQDQRELQGIAEELRAAGYSDSVISQLVGSTAQVAPSQFRIFMDGGKVGMGTMILGALLRKPGTGFRLGMMIGGARSGYRMEAAGIADDLAKTRDSRGKEIPPDEILFYSRIGGAIAGSLEFAGAAATATGAGAGKYILRDRARAAILRMAKNPVFRNRMVQLLGGTSFAIAGEVITENLQEIVTATAAGIRKNPDKDPAEVLMATLEQHKDQIAELSKTTAQGTGVITVGTRLLIGGGGAVARRLKTNREIKEDPSIQKTEAEEGRQEMEKAADAVEKSPLLKKRPEKIKEVMGEVPVFVPGEALRDFYEEQGQDGVARLREIFGHKVAQDFETALETGGDVRLSLPEALVEVATEGDSAFRDLLLGDGRLDPEGLSQKEADELATEIDDVQKEAEKDAVTPPEVPKEEETEQVQEAGSVVVSPENVRSLTDDDLNLAAGEVAIEWADLTRAADQLIDMRHETAGDADTLEVLGTQKQLLDDFLSNNLPEESGDAAVYGELEKLRDANERYTTLETERRRRAEESERVRAKDRPIETTAREVETIEQEQAERESLKAKVKTDIEKMFQEGIAKNQAVAPGLIENAEELAEVTVRIYENMANYMGLPLAPFVKREGVLFKHNQKITRYEGVLSDFFDANKSFMKRELQTTKPTYRFRPKMSESISDTFIHEMGHFIHMIYQLNYKAEGVSEQFNKDAETLFAWLGINPGDIEAANTDIEKARVFKTRHSETVAEGLQKYFHTGEAPKGLEQVFSRIQGWIRAIYRTLHDIFVSNGRRSLNLDVTPEMRDVFDRLLTLDDEVQSVISNHMAIDPNQTDAFAESLRLAGIEEERIPGILEKRDAALTEFRGQVAKREIKREQKRRNKKRQERERELDKEFREVYAAKTPAYGAASALANGEDTQGNLLENAAALRIGAEELDKLIFQTDWSKVDGDIVIGDVSLNGVAEIYGYGNAREMIQDIASNPPLDEAAREFAKSETDREFGDWTAEQIEQEIAEDVAEKLQVKMTLWERELLFTGKAPAIKGIDRTPRAQAEMASIREILGQKTLQEIAEGKIYNRAAKKWAKVADKALQENKKEEFLEAKRKEHINALLYAESLRYKKTAREIESAKKKLGDALESLRAQAPEVATDIEAFLNDTPATDQMIGDDIVQIHIKLKELISAASATMKSIMERETGVNKRAVEGLTSNDYLAGARAGATATDGPPAFSEPALKGAVRKFRAAAKRGAQALKLPEFIVLAMDSGQAQGRWWKAIWEPVERSSDNYLNEMAGVKDQLKKLINRFYTPEQLAQFRKRTVQAGQRQITKEEAISVLLNYGNEEGRKRLLNNGVDEAVAQQIFSQLGENDIRYAEEVWAYLDSFWKRVAELEAKTKESVPKRVEPMAFEIGGRTIKGGYYPLRYDAVSREEESAPKNITPYGLIFKGFFQGATAQTNDGHTVERAAEFGASLDLRLSVMQKHLDQVVYDLNYRESVLKVASILRDPGVKKALNEIMGLGTHADMVKWIKRVARNSLVDYHTTGSMSVVERAAKMLRNNTTLALMGYSIRVSALQPLGLNVSVKQFGAKAITKGLASLTPTRLEEMRELSPFMRERAQLMERDFYEYARDRWSAAAWGDSFNWIQKNAFSLIAKADLLTSATTWMAAYDMAMQGKVDGITALDKDAAVKYGDQAVRITQGSGRSMDISVAQAHSELSKLFTMFYSYFAVVYNQSAMSIREFRSGRDNVADLARAAFYLYVVPSVLEEMLLGHGDEDEETEETVKRYLTAGAGNILGMFPFIREFGSALEGFSPQMSPVFSMVGNSFDIATRTVPKLIDEDKEFNRTDRKNLVNTAGLLTGAPSAQLNRSMDALILWLEEDDTTMADFLRIISKGASPEERRDIGI